MKYALVNNVNTERSRRADFDIHRAGCADLAKISAFDIEYVEADRVSGVMSWNADNLEDGGFDRDSAEAFSYHVMPCAEDHS